VKLNKFLLNFLVEVLNFKYIYSTKNNTNIDFSHNQTKEKKIITLRNA